MLFIIDGAGVPSVAKMVQLDATAAPPPPAAPTISATVPDSPANDNEPEVTGSAEEGSIVSIYGDPSCTGPVLGGGSAADFNGSTGIAAALPGDQTTDLTATATDSAGNTSGCSSPFAYTEDSTPPAAPTISATVPDSPANDNEPEVTGSAEEGSIVSIYGDPSCTGPVLGGGSAADFNGSTGIAAALPGDQTTDLTATATDSAGNTSGCSSPFAYTEDSTPPATHITGGPKGTTTKHVVKFVFSSTERHSGFKCKLDRTPFAPCGSPVKKRVGLGKHRFKVRAIDPSGNTDASPAKRKFKVVRKRSRASGYGLDLERARGRGRVRAGGAYRVHLEDVLSRLQVLVDLPRVQRLKPALAGLPE